MRTIRAKRIEDEKKELKEHAEEYHEKGMTERYSKSGKGFWR